MYMSLTVRRNRRRSIALNFGWREIGRNVYFWAWQPLISHIRATAQPNLTPAHPHYCPVYPVTIFGLHYGPRCRKLDQRSPNFLFGLPIQRSPPVYVTFSAPLFTYGGSPSRRISWFLRDLICLRHVRLSLRHYIVPITSLALRMSHFNRFRLSLWLSDPMV